MLSVIVNATDVFYDYWFQVIPPLLRDDQMLQLLVYACQQSLSIHRECERIVRRAKAATWYSGFRTRFRELLDSVEGLRELWQLDMLIAATNDWDLDELPLRFVQHGSQSRARLLRQLSAARSYLHPRAYSMPTAQLRDAHERFTDARPSILEHALSMLKGLVVLTTRDETAGKVASRRFARVHLDGARSATLALRRVPVRLLLDRTALGAVEGIVRHVLSYYSDDVLVVATEGSLQTLSPWPRGAKLLTTRTDVAAVRGLAEAMGGVAEVYFCSTSGTLAPLLLRLGMNGQ